MAEHIRKRKMNDTKNAKKAAAQQRNAPETDSINLEIVDENTLKEDRILISSFEVLLKQYAKELEPVASTQAENNMTTNNNNLSHNNIVASLSESKTPLDNNAPPKESLNDVKKESSEAVSNKEKPSSNSNINGSGNDDRERERERDLRERSIKHQSPDRYDRNRSFERERDRDRSNRERDKNVVERGRPLIEEVRIKRKKSN